MQLLQPPPVHMVVLCSLETAAAASVKEIHSSGL